MAKGTASPVVRADFQAALATERPIPTTLQPHAWPAGSPSASVQTVLRPPVPPALPTHPRDATTGHKAVLAAKKVAKSVKVAMSTEVKASPNIASVPGAGHDAKLGAPSHPDTLDNGLPTVGQVHRTNTACAPSLIPDTVAFAFVSAMEDASALQLNATVQDQALTVAARVVYVAFASIGWTTFPISWDRSGTNTSGKGCRVRRAYALFRRLPPRAPPVHAG